MGAKSAAEEPGVEVEVDIEQEVRQMILDGFIDGLVTTSERRFPRHGPLVEDVVLEQIAQLVIKARNGKVKDPRAFLVWHVGKRLIDMARRPPTRYHDDFESFAPPEETPEEIAERNELFRAVKEIVGRWPNKRMQIITSMFLDARFYGEFLPLREAQTILREEFDEEMSLDNISKTLNRGFKKLAAEVSVAIREMKGGDQ